VTGRAEAVLLTLDKVEPHALTAGEAASAVLLDIRPSMRFRAGHLRGARWTNRARLGTDLAALPPEAPILLVAEVPILARTLARDLREATPDDPPDRTASTTFSSCTTGTPAISRRRAAASPGRPVWWTSSMRRSARYFISMRRERIGDVTVSTLER